MTYKDFLLLIIVQLCVLACTHNKIVPSVQVDSTIENKQQILVTFSLKQPTPIKRAGSNSKLYKTSTYHQSLLNNHKTKSISNKYQLRKITDWPLRTLDVHCIVFEVLGNVSVEEVLNRLNNDESIDSAQAMGTFVVNSNIYNDPFIKLQHGIQSLQVEDAHKISMGKGIKVAVVDTGIDTHHPELKKNISVTKNFVAHQQKVFDEDIHGTAVTGVIASAVNNGVGIVGVAPDVNISGLKACWQSQTGVSKAMCNSFTLAQAIDFAIKSKVHILNLSLSGPKDPLLERLIKAALIQGIIVICAYDKHYLFPSSVEGVITVNSANKQHPVEENTFQYLNAPGNNILTTLPGGHFDYMSGSSFAAAHISGISALMLSYRQDLTSAQILNILKASTHRVINQGVEAGLEATMVNACSALAQLTDQDAC